MIILALALPLIGKSLFLAQGQHIAEKLALIYGRDSDEIKKQQTAVVKASYSASNYSRGERHKVRYQKNAGAVNTVDKAKKEIKEVPDYKTEIVRTFVADVTVNAHNENGVQITAPVPLNFEIKPGGRSPEKGKRLVVSRLDVPLFQGRQFQTKLDGGVARLSRVNLPATVEVKIDQANAPGEWAVDGEVQDLGLVIPDDPHGEVVSKSSDTRVGYPKGPNGKPKKTIITTIHRVERLKLVAEPIQLRREVADFTLPKPAFLSSNPQARTGLFLGDQDEAKSILSESEDQSAWKFRIRRDAIGVGDEAVVVQTTTSNGRFGAVVPLSGVNFYADNKLPKPDLLLEALPESAVQILGKAVGNDFQLSPMLWRHEDSNVGSTSSKNPEPPKLITGLEACRILGVTVNPKSMVEPAPKGNEKGRFGRWLNFPEKGLGLRCRYELDSKMQGKPGVKALPPKETQGLLEAIRVFSPDAGSVGALKVGAARAEVESAFGAFDAPYDLSRIGLTPAIHAVNVYGDHTVEAPDDTLLHDGIRIKWMGDRVKWFEIARPVQLLYNGTKAFQATPAKSIFVGSVAGNNEVYGSMMRARIAEWAALASGFTAASTPEEADVNVSGILNTSASHGTATHTYLVSVTKHDKKGKEYTELESRNESFQCPEIDVSADLQIRITPSGTDAGSKSIPWRASRSSGGEHVQGQRCDPNESYMLASLLGMRDKVGDALRRKFTNECSSMSEVTGTVQAINYETGQMLVNLGRKQGIRAKTEAEGTEFDVYLLYEVDPKTGASVGGMESQRLMGQGFLEWVEVESVGDDWCVAVPKRKEHSLISNTTKTAYGQIPRLIDPGSGLLRVRVKPKGGAR